MSVIEISPARKAAARYLACFRIDEILVLQGSPLVGTAFAMPQLIHNVSSLAVFTLANLCLVAHIFMLNDWSGLTADRNDPNKASDVFTARGVGTREIAVIASGLLLFSLLIFSTFGKMTFLLALAIATLSAFYSLPAFNWKSRPLLGSSAHLAGGALHFLLGYSIGRAVDGRGVAIALFFGLTFAAGHLTQEVRDYQGDAANGIATNAVIFGPRRTFTASVGFFTLAYALLFALALNGVIARPLAALVLLYPFHLRRSLRTLTDGLTYASVSSLQSHYRGLYALIGLAMVAALLVR